MRNASRQTSTKNVAGADGENSAVDRPRQQANHNRRIYETLVVGADDVWPFSRQLVDAGDLQPINVARNDYAQATGDIPERG